MGKKLNHNLSSLPDRIYTAAFMHWIIPQTYCKVIALWRTLFYLHHSWFLTHYGRTLYKEATQHMSWKHCLCTEIKPISLHPGYVMYLWLYRLLDLMCVLILAYPEQWWGRCDKNYLPKKERKEGEKMHVWGQESNLESLACLLRVSSYTPKSLIWQVSLSMGIDRLERLHNCLWRFWRILCG